MMKTIHTIINGDCREMSLLKDCSVHLVVTSPPYWQLKDYGSTHEIGFNHTYEDYINHLNLVWQEAYRVLNYGCRLCINIGDQYARAVYYGRYKVIPIQTEIIRFCETIGFDYLGAIIWQKVATVNTSGGATIMGSFPFPRNGIVKMDYEFILLFKKHGTSTEEISKERKELSRMTKEEWNTYFQGHWHFPGEKQKKHLAMFPLELPRRLIKMFTYVGDTVLDPFLGSGTTTLAAAELNRNSVGYEINQEFIPIIKEKVVSEEKQLFTKPNEVAEFNFKKEGLPIKDFTKRLNGLPYLFTDPVQLDKIVADVKQMQFGSRLDKESSGQRQTYYRVKQIKSLDCIQLNNNKTIGLLGIKEKPTQLNEALAFLTEKIENQQVYLRFDKHFPDLETAEPIPCYLYLKNKTLINAHMLKAGLVAVDDNVEHHFNKRFLEYAGQKRDIPH